MTIYIQSFLIILLEIICCNIFFESFGKRRNESAFIKNNLIICLLLISVFLIAQILTDYFVLKEILIIVVTTILMYRVWRIHIAKSFILSVLYQGLLLAIDYLTLSIAVAFFSSVAEIAKTYIIGGILTVVLGKTILFVCVLLIKQSIGKKVSEILNDSEWLKFVFFPIFTICIIMTMIPELEVIKDQKVEKIFFVIAFGLIGMNITVFYMINDILKREQKNLENEIFKIKVENQTKMYHSISESLEKQRKKTHEYNNQILCIDSLIINKNYDDLENYVELIRGQLNKELDMINTNNVIINAILNTKYQEAVEQNILFIIKINDLSEIRIRDKDIVVILSNLLNNAIEACVRCNGKKIIKMKFVKEEGMIVLSVKNTFEGNLVYNDDMILTTKSVAIDEHGIGISNIIDAIKEYNGSYIIRDKNQEFYFSIIIPA